MWQLLIPAATVNILDYPHIVSIYNNQSTMRHLWHTGCDRKGILSPLTSREVLLPIQEIR